MAEIFERYGFLPITTPTFEHTELFTRTIGEATDIVSKEMYTFLDKGGRSLTLRPEGTAPVVRAFIEHGLSSMAMPVKLYYSGQMFRYERPQAGRFREFYQMGVEAIGSSDPLIDAENISLLHHVLVELGVGETDLHINSMGCKTCRPGFTQALAKDLKTNSQELCEDCRVRAEANPLRVFDCKQDDCLKALENSPKITDYLCEECEDHFRAVKAALRELAIDYILDSSLVRGFDYYTKTTFEVRSKVLGAQSALGGGGRYDGLVQELGGASTPAIGFAIGTERTIMAMEAAGATLPALANLDAFILTGQDSRLKAFNILNLLRTAGLKAEMDYGSRSFKGQMKMAGKLRAAFVIILGEDEAAKGKASVKEMATSEQIEMELTDILEFILKKTRT